MKNLVVWAIILGSVGYGGSKYYLHHKVEEGVDAAVLMMSPYVTVEYDGISSTMTGELTVDGIRARVAGFSDEIVIDRLGINTPSYFSLLELGDIVNDPSMEDDAMPEYFGLIAEGMHIPVNSDYYKKLYAMRLDALGATDTDVAAVECVGKYGFSPEALTAMGYDEQIMSMSVTMRNGDANYYLDISTDIENMWSADINMAMAGDIVSEMSKGRTYRPKMRSIEAEFTDLSLNQRVEQYCGRRGLTTEQTLNAQLDAFEYFGESNGIVFDEYLLEPYQEFLRGKSTIVFTAQPGEPVNFSHIDLYKPSDVPALLNLSASVH